MIGAIVGFLISLFPLFEFRFGIPIGRSLGGNIWVITLASYLGAVAGFLICQYFLPKVVHFVKKKSKFLDRHITRILKKTRSLHAERFKVFSEVGIIFFVFLPIPGSGVYTALLIQYVFDLPSKKSTRGILVGAFLGAILVAIVTETGFNLWNYIDQR